MAQSSNHNIESQLVRRLIRVGQTHTVGSLLLYSKKDADGKPASPLYRQYAHMMSCSNMIKQADGKLMTPYHCKCKACVQCNRLRTAELTDTYLPRLKKEVGNLYFVTLTRRNVFLEDLQSEVQTYYDKWRSLMNTQYIRKRLSPDREKERLQNKIDGYQNKADFWAQRLMDDNGEFVPEKTRSFKIRHFEGKIQEVSEELAEWGSRAPLIGLRKLEVTYHHQQYKEVRNRQGKFIKFVLDENGNKIPDPWYDSYHPHFHLIVNSKEVADWFVQQWLEANKGFAEEQSQKIVKCKNDYFSKELFKYFTKITAQTYKGSWIFVSKLDDILQAQDGKRIFQRFGSNESWRCEEVDEDQVKDEALAISDTTEDRYQFLDDGGSWSYVSPDTGSVLVSKEKRGKIFTMLRELERENPVDHDEAEKIRQEEFYEYSPPHYNPMPDMAAIRRRRLREAEDPEP